MGTSTRVGTNRREMRLRARWKRIIATSLVVCRRCNEPIEPGSPWDLGHPPERPYALDPSDMSDLAPEHRTCNRSGRVTINTDDRAFTW